MRQTEEPGTKRDNIVFDFDGVLHSDPAYRARFADIDLSPIELAHSRGLAATVMTCNDIWRVAAVVREAGYQVCTDPQMRRLFWDGERSGKVVLVTGRKVSAIGYLDDKGWNARYGDNFAEIIDTVVEAAAYQRRMARS